MNSAFAVTNPRTSPLIANQGCAFGLHLGFAAGRAGVLCACEGILLFFNFNMEKHTYRVFVRSVDYFFLDVEATNENEAEDIASEIDGGDWERYENGSWDIESVELRT